MRALERGRARCVPTIAWQGTPAWRARGGDLAGDLALRASCRRAGPRRRSTARAARMRASKPSASSTNAAPGSSPRRAPPTARRPARPRRRSSARRAGRAASAPASASRRSRSRLTRRAGRRPSAARRRSAARSNGVRTSHSTTSRAPRRPPPSSIASMRARAAVGRRAAAGRDEHDLRAGVDRGDDQLAGAARSRRLRRRARRRPRARARSPRPPRRSPCRRPRSARSPARRPGARAGRGRVGARGLAAQRGQQDLQRALAAVGDGQQVGRRLSPPRSRPAADRRRRPRPRAERALEGVGGDEDRAAHGSGIAGSTGCARTRVHHASRPPGIEVRVSSPGKVYFPAAPAVTKLDLVEYYLECADAVLIGLRERPTVLKRWRDGIEGEPFFQKRVPKAPRSGCRPRRCSSPSGRSATELVPVDAAHLVWAANLGNIDFNPWPVAPRRPRPPRRAAHRPRPAARRPVDRRSREVALTVDEVLARARPRRLPEDQRLARDPRLRAHRAALGLHRGAPRGARAGARGRAPHARAGRRRSGGRRSATASSSTTTRTPRPHGRQRLLGARRSPTRASRAGWRGTRSPTSSRPTCASTPCPTRLRERRRPDRRRSTTHAGSLDALLDLAAARRGAGPRRRAVAAALPPSSPASPSACSRAARASRGLGAPWRPCTGASAVSARHRAASAREPASLLLDLRARGRLKRVAGSAGRMSWQRPPARRRAGRAVGESSALPAATRAQPGAATSPRPMGHARADGAELRRIRRLTSCAARRPQLEASERPSTAARVAAAAGPSAARRSGRRLDRRAVSRGAAARRHTSSSRSATWRSEGLQQKELGDSARTRSRLDAPRRSPARSGAPSGRTARYGHGGPRAARRRCAPRRPWRDAARGVAAPRPRRGSQLSSWSIRARRRGGLSSRQRCTLAPWRMRPSETWSNVTSTTSSGRSATHSRSRPAVQRDGLARCRARRSRRARASPAARASPWRVKPQEWPTSRSAPSVVVEAEDQRADRALRLARAASRRRRASIVRTRLTFTIPTRSPGR